MPIDDLNMPSMGIIEAVDGKRKQAATKALDVSLNELADMYENRELVIRPEYQRLFRWSEEKQSQFIESLILEMPVPPLFTIELEQGKWELIDGLQRMSTYLHFRGLLDAPDRRQPINKGDQLELVKCDIVKELNGLKFGALPAALQIRLKRSFLRVEVVRRETDPLFRYYMFKRLNTGGEQLTDQEVRNCTIRILGSKFNDFLIELSRDEAFRHATTSLSDASRETMGDVELVLRFFAFKNDLNRFAHGIGEFLTTYMEDVTESRITFDYDVEREHFQRTFKTLSASLGEDTCRKWTSDKFGGGFSMHHFEAFAVGLGRLAAGIDVTNGEQQGRLRETLLETKKDPELESHTKGGGRNSPGLYRDKLSFVETKLRPAL